MFRSMLGATVRRGWMAAFVLSVLVVSAFPGTAAAQDPAWEVNVAPMYLWASELDGQLSANDVIVPVFMSFGDAAKKLAGAFSMHLDARRGRWGVLTDINFVRLTTDSSFTTPLPQVTVEGRAKLDMTIFEAGGSYLVSPEKRFSVIGGMRTYTLSPKLQLELGPGDYTVADASRTSVDVFGGFTYRPKLSPKWTLVSRGDLGAGQSNFTWSGTLGFEYAVKSWGGVMFGYHALGIDTGNVVERGRLAPASGANDVKTAYDMTHYGPFFAMTLHFRAR